MKNNKSGRIFPLKSVFRRCLRYFTLAIITTLVLSGCGSGGGSSGSGGGTPADTQIVISPSSALLTNSGQTQQLSAVVYKADGASHL